VRVEDGSDDGVSELAGWGVAAWLPDRVLRAMAVEDAHERAEAKRAQAEQEDRAEAAHDAALALYRRQAEARGEVVSALALATGEDVGRSAADVLTEAAAAADRQDAIQRARERREDGNWCYLDAPEPRIQGAASRAGWWPESEWEVDRLIRQAEDARSWMAGYQMRLASRQGRASEHIEAKRAQAEAARDQPTSHLTASSGYVARVTHNAFTGIW
jgi:hypothetical protein